MRKVPIDSATNCRITSLARTSEIIAIAGMLTIAIAVAILAFLLVTNSTLIDEILREQFLFGNVNATMTRLTRTLAYLAFLLPAVMGLLVLNQIRMLFASYRSGKIFDTRAARRLATVGWTLLVLVAVLIFSQSLGLLILTWLNAPGDRTVGIGFGLGEIMSLVVGLLLIVVGRILEEAVAISDENKSFV